MPRWGVLFAAVAVAGCGIVGLDDGGMGDLDAARERWEREGPASYSYGLELLCFCAVRGPVRVVVTQGVATRLTFIDSNDEVPAEYRSLFPTVEGLFDVLEDAIRREADEIRVTYDPVNGVPVDVWIDYSRFAADEEQGFRVTEPVAGG